MRGSLEPHHTHMCVHLKHTRIDDTHTHFQSSNLEEAHTTSQEVERDDSDVVMRSLELQLQKQEMKKEQQQQQQADEVACNEVTCDEVTCDEVTSKYQATSRSPAISKSEATSHSSNQLSLASPNAHTQATPLPISSSDLERNRQGARHLAISHPILEYSDKLAPSQHDVENQHKTPPTHEKKPSPHQTSLPPHPKSGAVHGPAHLVPVRAPQPAAPLESLPLQCSGGLAVAVPALHARRTVLNQDSINVGAGGASVDAGGRRESEVGGGVSVKSEGWEGRRKGRVLTPGIASKIRGLMDDDDDDDDDVYRPPLPLPDEMEVSTSSNLESLRSIILCV